MIQLENIEIKHGECRPNYGTMSKWHDNVDHMINFANKKSAIAKEHLARV